MHVEFAAHQEAHGGGELGLGFQDLRRLFLDDEGAAGDKRRKLRRMQTSGATQLGRNLEMTFFISCPKVPFKRHTLGL